MTKNSFNKDTFYEYNSRTVGCCVCNGTLDKLEWYRQVPWPYHGIMTGSVAHNDFDSGLFKKAAETCSFDCYRRTITVVESTRLIYLYRQAIHRNISDIETLKAINRNLPKSFKYFIEEIVLPQP